MSDQLRIGDAEREQAAADLGEHFAQGRLTADEHAERLDQVMRARTRAELAPLFSDLPGGTYGVRPASVRRTRPPGRRPLDGVVTRPGVPDASDGSRGRSSCCSRSSSRSRC